MITAEEAIPADDKIAQELAQYWINYYTEQLEDAKHLIEQEKQWIASLSKIEAKLLTQ